MYFSISKNAQEVINAWNLVYKAYRAHGLIEVNAHQIFSYPQYIMGNLIVGIGYDKDRLASCTISGLEDGPQGLPTENLFQTEIQQLRDTGKKLIEIGLLANLGAHSKRNLLRLESIPLIYGIQHGIFDFVAAVHPKSVPFYRHFFGFYPISEVKHYPEVNHAPAQLIHSDFQHINTRNLFMAKTIFEQVESEDYGERFTFNAINRLHPAFQFFLQPSTHISHL